MRFIAYVIFIGLVLVFVLVLVWLVELGRRLMWPAMAWIHKLAGTDRAIASFKEKTAEAVDGPVDPMEEIRRIHEAQVMSPAEQDHFYETFNTLAQDLTWGFRAQMSDNPGLLTPTVRRLVGRLYHSNRQPDNPRLSFFQSRSMGLPNGQHELIQRAGTQKEDVVARIRLQLAREAVQRHPRPAFMAIFENNLINLALAYRSEPPEDVMYDVLDALVKRMRSLDPDGFQHYQRTYVAQRPWQLIRWIVNTISAPAEHNRAGRAAIATAMADLLTDEEALHLYQMNAQAPFGPAQESGTPAAGSASIPAIERFVHAYVNTPNNQFLAVTALEVARRLCVVHRDKAEDLLSILAPAWRRQNPSEFLDDRFPNLGPVAPADLLEAEDLGSEDLDRMTRENPQVLGARQILLPAAFDVKQTRNMVPD